MIERVDQPKILTVDSSSLSGSVSLCRGESLIAESLLNIRSTHSEKLLQQIDSLLEESGWQLADLDLLAVVTGPGSFTGLRIGIATIKGIAQVLNKPVAPVSTLQTAAMNLPLSPVPICTFLDARKGEVYTQLFDWHGTAGPVAIDSPAVLPPQQLLSQLSGRVVLVGDGVFLYRQMIEDILAERALVPIAPVHQLRAANASWLALQVYQSGEFFRAEEILPTYIRPSDAELNLSKNKPTKVRVKC